MPLCPSTRTSRASAAVAATRAIRPACPDAACWHTHSAKARVLPKPRPASSSQTCQSPRGGNWLERAIAGQEASSASASCVAKELAILCRSLLPKIRKRGRPGVGGVEISQRRNHGVPCLRIRGHGADDPGDCSRVIGVDEDIVLYVQQRTALQLARQSPAIPEVLVQPPSQQRRGIAVRQLGRRAKSLVERTADNPIMVD